MMKQLFLILAIVVPCLLICQCAPTATYTNGTLVKGSIRYTLAEPGAGWKRLHAGGADVAWIFPQDGSTLLFVSSCEEEDAPLLALTGHLLIGMTEQQVSEQKTTTWSGREALQSTISVRVDGVPRKLKILVLKKDKCVYDVILSAPPEVFEAHLVDYNKVLAPFDVKGRLP